VSVVVVMGYGLNILLGPTSPKPNRQAETRNNTAPMATRNPVEIVRSRAGFFINYIISQPNCP